MVGKKQREMKSACICVVGDMFACYTEMESTWGLQTFISFKRRGHAAPQRLTGEALTQ